MVTPVANPTARPPAAAPHPGRWRGVARRGSHAPNAGRCCSTPPSSCSAPRAGRAPRCGRCARARGSTPATSTRASTTSTRWWWRSTTASSRSCGRGRRRRGSAPATTRRRRCAPRSRPPCGFVDDDRRRARVLYVEALGNEALNRRRIETGHDVVASFVQRRRRRSRRRAARGRARSARSPRRSSSAASAS